MEFSGTGSEVISLDEEITQDAILFLAYEGDGQLEIALLDTDGVRLDTIAEVVGPYDGSRIVDTTSEGSFRFIEVETLGDWSLRLDSGPSLPITDLGVGSELVGAGDTVFRVSTDGPTVINFSCAGCAGDIIVRSWSAFDTQRLVDAFGPYEGSKVIPTGDQLIEIRTSDDTGSPSWTLTVSE